MTFTERFDLQNFPFDVQDLSIAWSESKSSNDIIHIPSQIHSNFIRLEKTWIALPDFDILSVDCSTATLKSKSHKSNRGYEIVVFRIQVRRKWKGIIYRLCVWLLLLGMMSWSTFAIPIKEISERLSFAMGMVLTVIGMHMYGELNVYLQEA